MQCPILGKEEEEEEEGLASPSPPLISVMLQQRRRTNKAKIVVDAAQNKETVAFSTSLPHCSFAHKILLIRGLRRNFDLE